MKKLPIIKLVFLESKALIQAWNKGLKNVRGLEGNKIFYVAAKNRFDQKLLISILPMMIGFQ